MPVGRAHTVGEVAAGAQTDPTAVCLDSHGR